MKLFLLVVALSVAYSYEMYSIQIQCEFYTGSGCCYNGKIYKKGDTWPSIEYCLQVFCYGKNHTIVNNCAFVSRECSTGFKEELAYPDCCPTDLCNK